MQLTQVESFCEKCNRKAIELCSSIPNRYLGHTVRVLSLLPLTLLHTLSTPFFLIEKVAAVAINLIKINFSKDSNVDKKECKADILEEMKGICLIPHLPFLALVGVLDEIKEKYE